MSGFAGCVILVIEDEPLVALDISETFRQANARVEVAPTPSAALHSMGPEVAAAVLDLGLNGGDGQALCHELKSRKIPFVIYSGYPRPVGLDAPFIDKPTDMTALVKAVEGLIAHAVA
jgi:DNA-binding response OmpR family regulator